MGEGTRYQQIRKYTQFQIAIEGIMPEPVVFPDSSKEIVSPEGRWIAKVFKIL